MLASGAGWALLGGCTPARHAGNTLEWVVTNATPDTLLVAVRYPLDSAVVPPAQLPVRRQQLARDSSEQTRDAPLAHLARHQGHWYLVGSREGYVNTVLDHETLTGQQASVRRALGVVTYKLPPARTQLLTSMPEPQPSRPVRAVVGGWVRQGGHQQALPAGPALLKLFQPVASPQSQTDRYQLTIGPGLTLNP